MAAAKDAYKQKLLVASNERRAQHNTAPLQYSLNAEKIAQSWAEKLSQFGSLQHSSPVHRQNLGENIFETTDDALNAEVVVQAWYDQILYPFPFDDEKKIPAKGTGHFSQLVWAGTKVVGFGKASSNGKTFIVGIFCPPGNVTGYFNMNVRPRQNKAGKAEPLSAYAQHLERAKAFDTSPPMPLVGVKKTILEKANASRAKHGATALLYSKKADALAQGHADAMSKEQGMFHSTPEYRLNNLLGENLFSTIDVALSDEEVAAKAVDTWYDEVKKIDFKKEPTAPGTAHFTQLVWADSFQVGIGFTRSASSICVVMMFVSMGNVTGYYSKNVKPASTRK